MGIGYFEFNLHFPPLAEVNRSLVFLKYLEGMIPSWMQLRSAPESIKAMTLNSKSLLMTILTLECHFWKLFLLMVSRNFLWTMSVIGLSVPSSLSEESCNGVIFSLPWWRVFSKYFNLWLWSNLRVARFSLRVWTSDLVSLISFWRSLTVTSFFSHLVWRWPLFPHLKHFPDAFSVGGCYSL